MTADISAADWFRKRTTQTVLAALNAALPDGARFVGGCVRNTLLGEPVSDIDIATQLEPDETIEALTKASIRAIPTGIEHGTITGVCEHEPFEITSLRRDVETDGRRAVVAFTRDWEEDAQRRDFRMNALYADANGKVHDPTGGGLSDIADKKIVFIGEAEQRLREDHLRNLRFFRFTAWYADKLNAEGLAACAALKDGLDQIAAERIWKEWHRLLEAPSPYKVIAAMQETGVLNVILPETETLDRLNGLAGIEAKLEGPLSGMQRLLTLLPQDEDLMAGLAGRLRMSGVERDRLVDFARAREQFSLDMKDKDAKATLYRLGDITSRDVIVWLWAGDPDADWMRLFNLASDWERPEFPVRGADLIRQGYTPGPQLGEKLREIENAWIENGFSMDGL
ncbi:MAG: CCA tRNA nucleotidyltransferase [Ponticaulis sp.]|nr:CCA tRNA nucleotidyltransferase [Ponticaulis sp.]|tara:strand:+ start:4923 stop:6110 length:1188 start_codon:yes stop_codon:yes gene_type:complete